MAEDSRLPGYAVRPGVTFPDWAVVTAPQAREALLAIFEAIGAEGTWRDYTPAEDDVRTTLLRLYAEQESRQRSPTSHGMRAPARARSGRSWRASRRATWLSSMPRASASSALIRGRIAPPSIGSVWVGEP